MQKEYLKYLKYFKMNKIKFRDYFNEANIIDLGYGYIGCFLMWIFGTNDIQAIHNIVISAENRLLNKK